MGGSASAPVVTVPVMVLSKRKNRRIKADRQAQSGKLIPFCPRQGPVLRAVLQVCRDTDTVIHNPCVHGVF